MTTTSSTSPVTPSHRHTVTPGEVEHVVYLDLRAIAFNDDTHRAHRLIILGVTKQERHLVVAFDSPTPLADHYVVTARPMTEKERALFEEER